MIKTMYKEPPRDEILENLCNAIIEQAVIDYRANVNRDSCDRFFRSERFKMFTTLDGNMIADRLAMEAKKKRDEELNKLLALRDRMDAEKKGEEKHEDSRNHSRSNAIKGRIYLYSYNGSAESRVFSSYENSVENEA